MRAFALLLATLLPLLSACSSLSLPGNREAQATWELDPETPLTISTQRDVTLDIVPPTAVPALATSAMAYRQRNLERRYYAANRWVKEPAQLLHPLLVRVFEESDVVATVWADGGGRAHYRLETQLLELEHDYRGSEHGHGRVELRARIIDNTRDSVLATRRFQATAASDQSGPAGGARAINEALGEVLTDLVRWLPETVPERE
ncbi:MAG: ABC-type transport auxiliary lipoprotein family protein [Ectothiorhodospiraceae bacterium]